MMAVKKSICYFLVIVFGLLISTQLFAQDKKIYDVYFKDGTFVQGRVLEMNTSIIKLKSMDGKIVVKKFDDIESIEEVIVTDKGELVSPSSRVPQDIGGRFGLGIRTGFRHFEGDDFSEKYETGGPTILSLNTEFEIDNSFIVGLNATYFITNIFSMELSADYIPKTGLKWTDIDLKINGIPVVQQGELHLGDVSIIPLLLTARLHIPTGTQISSYLGGGIGWYFIKFDIDTTTWGQDFDMDLDHSFGYHICLGTEIFFSNKKNVSFNLDAKYMWTNADYTISYSGEPIVESDIDLDGFYLGAGFKFYF